MDFEIPIHTMMMAKMVTTRRVRVCDVAVNPAHPSAFVAVTVALVVAAVAAAHRVATAVSVYLASNVPYTRHFHQAHYGKVTWEHVEVCSYVQETGAMPHMQTPKNY